MSDDGNCFVIFDETDVSIPIFKSFSSPLKIKYISVNIKIGARNISARVRLSRNISFNTRLTIAKIFMIDEPPQL
ncbi:Uncharacterised protein [Staphylococcus aureus]|nr:Uncharacterised protein [Staphylococcus aureus]CPM15056.1 Uncharacterised protein [Staphylococcus aureus]